MAKFFTADFHFNESFESSKHSYFRKYAYGFESPSDMNNLIINNINKFVAEDDELYIIGDVSVDNDGVNLLSKIKCKNLYLIVGNKDEDKLDILKPYFKSIKEDCLLKIQNKIFYINHYPTKCLAFYEKSELVDFCLTGHIYGCFRNYPEMLNVGVDSLYLCPYSEDMVIHCMNASKKFYGADVFPYEKYKW